MSMVNLDFANFTQLDEGRIAKLLAIQLEAAARDIDNRPHELGKRKVILEITFTPVKGINNDVTDRVFTSITCNPPKVPKFQSTEYDMQITRKPRSNGQSQFGFQFSTDFADDADQRSLFPDSGESAE